MENLKSTLLCKSRSEAHLVNDCNDPMRHYNGIFVDIDDDDVVFVVDHGDANKR